MAITLADFTKIWASTSPLTPYSFSDANYQEGWNFVGGTPPARQMWDSIQKQNDEKLKYIVDNFLPLSGGTMTGTITTNGFPAIKHTSNAYNITIVGGSSTGSGDGAKLILTGADNTDAGAFTVQAGNGGGYKQLVGKADGTLTWDGKTIQTSATLTTETTETTYTLAGNTAGEFFADVSKTSKTILGIVSIRTYSTGVGPLQWWMDGSYAHVYLRNFTSTSASNLRLVFSVLYANT